MLSSTLSPSNDMGNNVQLPPRRTHMCGDDTVIQMSRVLDVVTVGATAAAAATHPILGVYERI